VRGDLPATVDEPIVAKEDVNAQPIIWLALSGEKYSTLELTELARNVLSERIQRLDGVASVFVGAERKYAMRIWLDPQRLASYGLTVDDIERALGRLRYLAFYLLAGAVGGLVFVANDPHSKIELIGASGAIAGVVIAYVMLRPCAKITVLLGIIPLRIGAYWVVGLFVILQLWNLGSASKSDVAYWCHFGGMLAGAVLFPLMRPPGVKLFQCMQPVPDTVVQLGPYRAARLPPDRLR